jgi:hypothetical protein
MSKVNKSDDPLDINQRLYKQVGKLLDDMEAADRNELMTMPQRISALIAVGRIQKMFQDLRKGEFNANAGSSISKYATAFAPPDATGRGDAKPRRSGGTVVSFDPTERDEDDIRDELDS